jgi:hypothetical protein
LTDVDARAQVYLRPRKVAKPAGTPNRVMETSPAPGARVVRASRSCQERRECARPDRDWSGDGEAGQAASCGQLLEGSPRHAGCARVAYRRADGFYDSTHARAQALSRARGDGAAHVPVEVFWWLCPSIDTLRAADRDGNCGCWLQTRRAGFQRLLCVTHAWKASDQRGSRLVPSGWRAKSWPLIRVLATWNIRSEKATVRAIEPAFTGCKKTCSRGKI